LLLLLAFGIDMTRLFGVLISILVWLVGYIMVCLVCVVIFEWEIPSAVPANFWPPIEKNSSSKLGSQSSPSEYNPINEAVNLAGLWMGVIPIIRLGLLSPNGGGTHQQRGEFGWSPSEGNPNSGVCLTSRRLADRVPVGGFTLPSPSEKNSSSRVCEHSWSLSGRNLSSVVCLTAHR